MITGVKIVAYAEQNEREESPMTHTPDQIRRADEAEYAYKTMSSDLCPCCGHRTDWLAAVETVEADVLAKLGIEQEQGGKWVQCNGCGIHDDGTRLRHTFVVGNRSSSLETEHWEPVAPPDPLVAAVTDWASSLGLADESVRDLLARLDAAKEG